ncbi:MAG: carboxylesterase family protein [Deltaproteobacteria bacterium]|nr:carboxylesterase family protein [Deltaproteobacteria bacterium]
MNTDLYKKTEIYLFVLLSMMLSCGSDEKDTSDAGGSTGGSDASGGSGGSVASGGGGGETTGGMGGDLDAAPADGAALDTDGEAGQPELVPTEEIQTASGKVRGTISEGVRKFMGIPFAATTAGENRWKPPQPVTAWSDTLDAFEAGPICPQNSPLTREYDTRSDEDCLSVNVWTPDPVSSTPLPVMVWIFPGAYIFGSGSEPQYDGSNLVKRGNVIMVSFNYRVSSLGFLAHRALTEEDPDNTSGNYGILDQLAALKWVRANIEAFGGDKDNVTLFGESAGGNSTLLHIVMPGSRGLFHRAIVESGIPMLDVYDLAGAEEMGDRYAKAMGCTDDATVLSCMRALSAEQILTGPSEPPAELPGGLFYDDPATRFQLEPIADGVNIPDTPRNLFMSNQMAKVSMIQGSNTEEGVLFHTGVFGDIQIEDTLEAYQTALSRTYGSYTADIVAEYPIEDYASANDALTEVSGDANFVCASRRLARLFDKAGIENYLYSFSNPVADTPLPQLENIAFHSADIPFVFGTKATLGAVPQADQSVSEAIQDYWTRFARTGDPNGEGSTQWPAYVTSSDQYLHIRNPIEVASALKPDKCDFWDTIDELMYGAD